MSSASDDIPEQDQKYINSLKNTFHQDAFRPHQLEIIKELDSGRNVCAYLPTGFGKSLCFQVNKSDH